MRTVNGTKLGRRSGGGNPTLACLHGHHGNVAAIDGLFPAGAVDVVHYVDPGLLRRTAADPAFPVETQRARVAQHLDWIAACGCDAVVVACTAYAAHARETAGAPATPVVTIDAPFFAALAAHDGPVALAFTNPGTMEPTMSRLRAALGRASSDIRPVLIPDVFHLVMNGRADAYEAGVIAGLRTITAAAGPAVVAVAQLSMTGAARRVASETGVTILDPLDPLTHHLADLLGVGVPSRI